MGIKKIRRAVRQGHYEYSIHALEEMDEDDLTEEDVRTAILHGTLVAELTDDPRGVRFVVQGTAKTTACELEVVGRFLPLGLMRIITVYALKE
ncbi:MAG: DUF4258 domain-containing protein [Acidobacteria bacterium]|nr:DUF4258 domain-containing protein [Acidobacteriota bacterium]